VAMGGEGKTSLVAKWAAGLAHGEWEGCDGAFAWSFYSQGTREQYAASSDLFLREALAFFGDAAMASGAQGAHEKGKRLAELVGTRKALLILDGLEPLQYAPTSPTPGELMDQGVTALLKRLAVKNHGLCVVTTRYSISDLKAYWQTTAPEVKLYRLSKEAGVVLLRSLGVKGLQKEFEALVEDVKGHALTLNLLGTFLRDAHGGDIRRRDLVNFEEADTEEQRGHAFRVMDAYVRWMAKGPPEGRSPNEGGGRALGVLRLMGFFDRPATADCLGTLWKAPAIEGLTEELVTLSEGRRNVVLKQLEEGKLLTVNRDGAGQLVSLDAHPLVREYFAVRIKGCAGAWREGHRRLYKHLCKTAPKCTRVTTKRLRGRQGEKDPTLEDLQPLYQAVAHGCQAGLQQETCDNVYFGRILRGNQHYSELMLGAYGSEVGAHACFFMVPWSRVSKALTEEVQGWLLSRAAVCLAALGRVSEALEPMRGRLVKCIKQKNWLAASDLACSLSQLEVHLGILDERSSNGLELAGAVADGERAVTYADRSGYAEQRMISRATHGDALHAAGKRGEAEGRFREAEQMQRAFRPGLPLLYSLAGFGYSEVLLGEAERGAWREWMEAEQLCPVDGHPLPPSTRRRGEASGGTAVRSTQAACALQRQVCRAVAKWAEWPVWRRRVFEQRFRKGCLREPLLKIGLDHLKLGLVRLYKLVLERKVGRPAAAEETPGERRRVRERASERANVLREVEAAVDGLRRAGQIVCLPLGLLTRAWVRAVWGARVGADSAASDLEEAWEIAERGPMPLFMADIHLYRARLFFREAVYPWGTFPVGHARAGEKRGPGDDLAEARRLIVKHGYGRRLGELEDAEKAILGRVKSDK